jgi:hypothetical protein
MGGSGNTQKQQEALTQQQIALGQQQAGIGQQYIDLSQAQLQRSTNLQQPLVDFYTGITQGNSQSKIAAASPVLGQIANSTKQAEANIYNTIPAGAGRDEALAQAQIGQGQQNASTLNSTFNTALQQLAAMGTGSTQAGLGLASAGFTGLAAPGLQQGQQGLANVAQEQNQQKASTMGFFGSLVGAAGNAASGGVLGSLGGGSSGGGGSGQYGFSYPNPGYEGAMGGTA